MWVYVHAYMFVSTRVSDLYVWVGMCVCVCVWIEMRACARGVCVCLEFLLGLLLRAEGLGHNLVVFVTHLQETLDKRHL